MCGLWTRWAFGWCLKDCDYGIILGGIGLLWGLGQWVLGVPPLAIGLVEAVRGSAAPAWRQAEGNEMREERRIIG